VHQVGFAALIESDGDFQNQEQVIAGAANFSQNFSDAIRFCQRLVNRAAQFLDQLFEFAVEFQKSPLQ